MKTYVLSLGCPKNLVDTEASISFLQAAGCETTTEPDDADLLVVGACSFLDIAWQETVAEVGRLSRIKKRGRPKKKLILMGCLPKHRKLDLRKALPDVDYFLPTGAQERLPSVIDAWRRGEDAVALDGHGTPVDRYAGFENRTLLTPKHTAYVKIAEGCNRTCSFCAIPRIRGRMTSRTVSSLVREVEGLVARGVKEISLLAQDVTSYHRDGLRFPDLVDAIAATGVRWIRLFYLHPASLTIGLVRRLFAHPAVCRYLEAPVQHASDRLLERMRRSCTRSKLESLFARIREEFPDVKIRSEVIVGFPGETDEDFEALKDFVASAGFSSLGIFAYSGEPGTRAISLDGAVPDGLKRERAAELAEIQEAVAFGIQNGEKGKKHDVLVDRELDGGDASFFDDCTFAGRFYGQALDIDGEVYLQGEGIRVGDFVSARITDADVFDLAGVVE